MADWQDIFNQITNTDKKRLKVYRGTNRAIEEQPDEDGALYFAYDTGAIFLGRNTGSRIEKIQMSSTSGGGTGNGNIVYANADEEEGTLFEVEDEDNEDYGKYYIYRSAFEETLLSLPGKDTLIVNSNGWLFRAIEANGNEGYVIAELVSTGSGDGSSSGNKRDLDLTYTGINLIGSQYIYNKDFNITFYPSSMVDSVCSLKITVVDNTGNNPDVVRTYTVQNNTPCKFNTSLLPLSNDMSLTALVTSVHSEYNKKRGYSNTFPIKTIDMRLEKHSDSEFVGVQTGAATLAYIPYFSGLGTTTDPVKLYYSIDNGQGIESTRFTSEVSGRTYVTIPHQQHGTHIITLWLSVVMDGNEFTSDSIVYEVPFIDVGNTTPLIWIKESLGTVIQYEQATIQYMVYSPEDIRNGRFTEVQILKDGVIFNTQEVEYSSSSWLDLDLTTQYNLGRNIFTIACGSTSKTLEFYVTSEGARDLKLKYESELELNFDSMGRSSREIKSSRETWVSSAEPKLAAERYKATLLNFNWYNNGWLDDNDGNGSYLAITNDASVSIPSGNWQINTPNVSWTFEIRFRVRNAKKYATLVTEIPIYKWKDANGHQCADGEEKSLEDIAKISGAEVVRDQDGNLVMNEANTTKKVIRSDKYIAFKYLNSENKGFAIGTQEAYFNVGGRVVNVKYKEDEIINISFVVNRSGTTSQLLIYLNGILSGVGDLNGISSFQMANIPFQINSEYCDFDLYKFRIYQKALSMPDIIHNYIADIKSIDLYDENQLTEDNDDTRLSYQKLINYNASHINSPSMPYVVIDMSGETSSGNNELPYAKTADGINGARIEFTNPTADYLLSINQITPWVYYTSSPSYEANNVNINVQGTSSQIYPRRNFKTKFKKANNWIYTSGPLAGKKINTKYYFNEDGSFAADIQSQVDSIQSQIDNHEIDEAEGKNQIKALTNNLKVLSKDWHMDSERFGSNKFTWKIDYMESSGSYNTGFANLLGNMYEYHPLDNLGIDGTGYRTSVYGFPMLTFHKTSENEYTYIGRYNYNLDKSSNERYGFELEEEQPYMDGNPLIADIAECWELRDNQGTWCSFRYPTENRQDGFETKIIGTTDRLEVLQHFEARYLKEADAFEWGQNVMLNKQTTEDYSSVVGSISDMNTIGNWLLNKMSNLRDLFEWLDSTDRQSADSSRDLNPYVRMPVSGRVSPEEASNQGIQYREENGVTYGIFYKDSEEYRRQKFYNEFDKHLDKEYCAIYFVLTELLLCYDSRGKNMMMATFGPTENSDGNYVWYPIFYDIDTQLGLNNVGAQLWDYSEDCTENNTFSTAQSVLWTNFFDLFKNSIIQAYIRLRGAGDDGKLSYRNIEGAYTCDPNVFKSSLAMRGRRPIIAIGLDEYYKYVLPLTQAWRSQEGSMITANYLYACQGDRKLSRELLINNRLIYMDSKWGAGKFQISTGGMAGAMFRSTANHEISTSDKYLDLKNPQINVGESFTVEMENSDGQLEEHTYIYYPYKQKKQLDSVPEYKVAPYLKFYITTFVDENTYKNYEPYDEDKYPDGMLTIVSPSVQEAYQYGRVDQQLNYFAGSPYISSLGDLSTKYANQIKFPDTQRLLDITLGSDAPGYFNNEPLNPFELYTEVDSNTGLPKDGCKKSLLEKIILSNMLGLDFFLDVRSPDKLKEFRALGTRLPYALFANGAPLTTVHLPNTTQRLIFIQNKNLTKILTETPQVLEKDGNEYVYDENGDLVYREHSLYEGLFVDGLTNYDSATMDGQGSPIFELDIEGSSLGYDSYTLLNNLIHEKLGASQNNTLQIKLTDVEWTPYIQVEYGESKDTNTSYYYLTDHSSYEPYTHDNSQWNEDTLNGRVFTFDQTVNANTIQNLDLLDIFYNDYQNNNNFTNNIQNSGIIQKTYPTLSGELFVNNDQNHLVSELDLTNKYNVCWPDLVIRAAYVDEAPAVKYVEIDSVTGKEKQIDIKYSDSNEHIVLTDKNAPTRVHHDFLGWSPNKPGTTDDPVYYIVYNNGWVLTDEGAAATIDQNTNVLVLYAIFAPHAYEGVFNFNDDDINPTIITVTTTWELGKIGLNAPATIPYKPYPYADDEITPSGEKGLYRVYAFKGWAFVGDEENIIQNLDILPPDHNYNFIAIYEDKSVYDNVLDLKYLDYNFDNISNKYYIGLKNNYILQGKITLPTQIDDHIITQLGSLSANFTGTKGNSISHIFFEKNNRRISSIYAGCFSENSGLTYLEPIETCTQIGERAFYGCSNLKRENLFDILQNVQILGTNAFGAIRSSGTFNIPGHAYSSCGTGVFSGWNRTTGIIIGSENDTCDWFSMLQSHTLSSSSGLFDGTGSLAGGIQKLHIYIDISMKDNEDLKEALLISIGLSGKINDMVTVVNTINPSEPFAWIAIGEEQ